MGWLSSGLEKLSLFSSWLSHYSLRDRSFQERSKEEKSKKYTVNNNVLFVPKFGTFWSLK
jgi:hypothetical protein